MKRSGPRHPKMLLLADLLGKNLTPKELARTRHFAAVGLSEMVWHFTEEFAPQGNIGKYDDARIEAALGWNGRRGVLIRVLTEAGLIDQHPTYRLVVHDWHEHCNDSVKKKLERSKLPFLSVAPKVTGQDETKSGTQEENGSLPLPGLASTLSGQAAPVPRIPAASSSNNSVHTEPAKADDDAASVFVAGVRKRWEELQIACGRWTDANEKIAREQFRKGTSLEEMERVITWGSIMRFKHCRNKGSDGKIVSLQYHVDCLNNDDFRRTTAPQLANMLKRCEQDLAQHGALSPAQEGAA